MTLFKGIFALCVEVVGGKCSTSAGRIIGIMHMMCRFVSNGEGCPRSRICQLESLLIRYLWPKCKPDIIQGVAFIASFLRTMKRSFNGDKLVFMIGKSRHTVMKYFVQNSNVVRRTMKTCRTGVAKTNIYFKYSIPN